MSAQVCALSIAGSDSGGGAGVQADLRVLCRLGVFGTTAITAVTAQNLDGVSAIEAISPRVVDAQVRAVIDGFAPRAIKTGMLHSRAIVETVAELAAASDVPMIVDPVMVATSGARLLDEDAIAAYRRALLPHAYLATPNLDEAAVLLGWERIERARMDAAAAHAQDALGCAVLLKGGHLRGDPVDVLAHPGGLVRFAHARVDGVDTHGTGCMLSAAIAGFTALGQDLVTACQNALTFVHDALTRARPVTQAHALAGIESATWDAPHVRVL